MALAVATTRERCSSQVGLVPSSLVSSSLVSSSIVSVSSPLSWYLCRVLARLVSRGRFQSKACGESGVHIYGDRLYAAAEGVKAAQATAAATPIYSFRDAVRDIGEMSSKGKDRKGRI